MRQYLAALEYVREFGIRQPNRTGVDTLSIFGYQMNFNLQHGFPLLTTKKMFFKGIVVELLWLISGQTNIRPMQEQGVHIWDEWADENGELGPVYGKQWRDWSSVIRLRLDQLSNAIELLRTDPSSRRNIVTAWNPDELHLMKLPPCHLLYQFGVSRGMLNCHMFMRSADLFLGVPFNIASYALLTEMVAQCCGLLAGKLVISFSDLHLYVNHLDQVVRQLEREPRSLPVIWLDRTIGEIDGFQLEHVELVGYQPHPAIKADVAV